MNCTLSRSPESRKHKEKSADSFSLATDVDSRTPPRDSEIGESQKPNDINSEGPGLSDLFASSKLNKQIHVFVRKS